MNVGASSVPGQMQIYQAKDNVQAVNPAYATEWMSIEKDQYPLEPKAVQYLSFNAPLEVPPEEQCGRAVYTDLHVSSTGADAPGQKRTVADAQVGAVVHDGELVGAAQAFPARRAAVRAGIRWARIHSRRCKFHCRFLQVRSPEYQYTKLEGTDEVTQ